MRRLDLEFSVWSYSNLQPHLMKTEFAMPILSQVASNTNGPSVFKGWSCSCCFQHAKRQRILYYIPYVAFNMDILGLKKATFLKLFYSSWFVYSYLWQVQSVLILECYMQM